MNRESISFARLNDETWGVRFASKAQAPSPGDQVQVTKRDGTTQTVTLGSIVSRDAGAFPGSATYYRVAGKKNGNGRAPAKAAPATPQTRVMRPLDSGAYAVLVNGACVGHVLPAANGFWAVTLDGTITHHDTPTSAAQALVG